MTLNINTSNSSSNLTSIHLYHTITVITLHRTSLLVELKDMRIYKEVILWVAGVDMGMDIQWDRRFILEISRMRIIIWGDRRVARMGRESSFRVAGEMLI